jgi:hypothetical protein
MKNVQVFSGYALKMKLESLFVTPEMKKFLGGSYLDRIYNYPIWFYTPSHPTERSHFTSFFRHLAIRNYDNPNINDMYYLHELTHMLGMTEGDTSYENFCEVTSFEDWYKAMNRVEFRASLMSEVLIYLNYGSLRPKTFKMEIWVDRFLNNPTFMDLPIDRQEFIVRTERMKAMLNVPNDENEVIIHKYHSQNRKWAEVWNPQFLEVCCYMNEFTRLCRVNGKHDKAIKFLETFIERNTIGEVPFAIEAQRFHNLVNATVTTVFTV